MCTLARLCTDDGYLLWHSRDERRSRAPGLPPRLDRSGPLAWVAPVDAEAGGTWVGVNAAGIAIGIANYFGSGPPLDPARKVSRGLLVQSLLPIGDPAEVRARVEGSDLDRFEGFTLAILAPPPEPPLLLQWDRRRLVPVEPLGPVLLVSSAGGHQDIVEARRRLFLDLGGEPMDPARVEALYRSPADPAGFSVTVDFPEVSTMSLVRIEVRAGAVSLSYTPGPPDRTPAGAPVVVERAVEGGRRR